MSHIKYDFLDLMRDFLNYVSDPETTQRDYLLNLWHIMTKAATTVEEIEIAKQKITEIVCKV